MSAKKMLIDIIDEEAAKLLEELEPDSEDRICAEIVFQGLKLQILSDNSITEEDDEFAATCVEDYRALIQAIFSGEEKKIMDASLQIMKKLTEFKMRGEAI